MKWDGHLMMCVCHPGHHMAKDKTKEGCSEEHKPCLGIQNTWRCERGQSINEVKCFCDCPTPGHKVIDGHC